MKSVAAFGERIYVVGLYSHKEPPGVGQSVVEESQRCRTRQSLVTRYLLVCSATTFKAILRLQTFKAILRLHLYSRVKQPRAKWYSVATTAATCFSSPPTRAGWARWSPVPVPSHPLGMGWGRHQPELCHPVLLFANLSCHLLSSASVPTEGFQKIAPRNSCFVTFSFIAVAQLFFLKIR